MGVNALFDQHDIGPWLKSLPADQFAALDALLIEKNGRAYFQCPVRKKDILAKPEECVRQYWLHLLQFKYGYPLNRLAVEYPITFGRDSSKRADIVVFDADRPTVPYIVVEVKQGKAKDGKEQLRSYTHATGAPLAMWSNGPDSKVWNRKNPNYLQEIPHIPTATQDIEDIINEPWTLQTLEDKENERALTYGEVHFIVDADKNFSALIDVLYGLRNALFHGSITPNDTHNQIYKPAYLIAMRLVKCTL